MEYLNIHTSVIDGEAMQDAASAARGVWLLLARYCAGQENGGRIAGAAAWGERKWLKLGLEKAEVDEGPKSLWRFEGGDLVVEFYPLEQELALQKKRGGGRLGGRKRAENEANRRAILEAASEAMPEGKLEANRRAILEAELERKGREGKEKKGKEREAGSPGVSDPEGDGEVLIPTEAEVRTWAEMSAVEPEFASEKWAATSERHGWVQNGRLVDWRRRFKRFWEADKGTWTARQKKGLPGNGTKPTGWRQGDQEWWWSEGCETVERALAGALMGGDEVTTGRLREVLTHRREGKK